MSHDLELARLRALVRGGTMGIGEAVVARLRELGARVQLPSAGYLLTAADYILAYQQSFCTALASTGVGGRSPMPKSVRIDQCPLLV